MAELRRRFVWEVDWNLLRTFMVIAQEKSLTAAGERLSLKQPTISHALRRLEEHTACRLVERRANLFSLTPAGERLYGECVAMFDIVAGLPDMMRQSREEVGGHVDMAFASHIVCPFFDEFLTGFHAEFPRISFSTNVVSSQDAVQAVSNQDACLGICLAHEKQAGLDYTVLYREYFGFFCAPGHPLFGRNGLRLSDLHDLPYVSFRTDELSGALRPVALLREQAGFKGPVLGLFSNLEEVKRLIKLGFGFGPLPVHTIEDDIAAGQLWRLPPYEDLPAVDVFAVTKSSSRHSRAEQLFLGRLKGAIGEVPLSQRTYPLTPPKPVRNEVRLSPSSSQR